MEEVQQAAISAAQSCVRRLIISLVDADRDHEFPSLRKEHTLEEITNLYLHYGGKL